MQRILLLTCMVFFPLAFCLSQGSAGILTFEEYLSIVKMDHPITYQALLLNRLSEGRTRMAKGGFDPKLDGSWNHKSFDGKNYYSLASGEIKIPTWYGIEIKGGYERSSGEFLNNSEFLPTNGLWNAGISVPLGRGLVIDERRAELQKAEIFQNANEQEQILLMNELYYDAIKAYINWQVSQAFFDIASEGITFANQRLRGTRSSFMNGDKPAIDTLESFISLQSRQQELLKAQQSFINATLEINNFLWLEGEIPLELDSATTPEAINIEFLSTTTDSIYIFQNQLLQNHPELALYDLKIQDLEIDQRLQREDLKPDIRLAYNPLIGTRNDALFDDFQLNNFKFGATVSYPILQRKQRGKIQMTEVKIKDNVYQQDIKMRSLNVKLNSYQNNITQSISQVSLLDSTVINYRRMLDAENRRFSFGESSIFLINNREVNYLNSRYKAIETRSQLIKYRYTYLFYLGQLSNIL